MFGINFTGVSDILRKTYSYSSGQFALEMNVKDMVRDTLLAKIKKQPSTQQDFNPRPLGLEGVLYR